METNEERKWCVYMHVNVHNDKKYIGMTCQQPEERWRANGVGYLSKNADGTYKNPAFGNALNKYSDWDNDWKHIIVTDGLTKDEAEKLEIELIALHKTNCCKYYNPTFGYNCTDGGDGGLGREWTEESRQKPSRSLTGHPTSNETKEKISRANMGRKRSDETRKKSSEAHKGKNAGKDHYLWGKHQPENVRQKISETKTGSKHSIDTINKMSKTHKERLSDPRNHPNYGKHLSEEHRRHLSEANIGKTLSDDAKKKISEAQSTPVVQLNKKGEFITIFSSIVKAEHITNVPHHISDCCYHKRQTCGGYQWVAVYDITLTNSEIIPGAITLGIVTEEQIKEALTLQND